MRVLKLLQQHLLQQRLVYGLGMRLEEIELLGLSENPDRSADFVSYRDLIHHIRPAVNELRYQAITDNKWIFYQLMSAFGVTIPPTFALYDSEYGITSDGEPCRTPEQLLQLLAKERPSGLVAKPAGGIGGDRVLILEDLDFETWEGILPTGQQMSLVSFFEDLETLDLPRGRGWVIQEAIDQHSFFANLSPFTTNTVRVVTHITHNGDVLYPFAFLKLGRQGRIADNWSAGGIAVGINPSTGVLSRGIQKPKFGEPWVSRHPDTGAEFNGLSVPMWEDVLETCAKAALTLPEVRLLGWDVIITESAVMILEANDEWATGLVQALSGAWLAQPGIRDEFSLFGIDFPLSLPSITEIAFDTLERRLLRLRKAIFDE